MSTHDNQNNKNNTGNSNDPINPNLKIREKNLEQMESMLKQSALGIHLLFDNVSIAKVFSKKQDDRDFFDFNKMKRVQDVMTALIGKKNYFDKMDFLSTLDTDSYELLVRIYFHIVENTVRASFESPH